MAQTPSMTSNRAVEHFLYAQNLSIEAYGVDDWVRPHLEHINQEAGTLAARVYHALAACEALQSNSDENTKERLSLEMGAILFRIKAVRDVVEATTITLITHGRAPSHELKSWVYMLNDAAPIIVHARTSLSHQNDESLA